jgi:hypothetical protein
MNDHAAVEADAVEKFVRTTDRFEWQDLVDLVDGGIVALRLVEFYPADMCRRFSASIMSHRRAEHYAVAPDIKKVGKAIFDAASDPSQLEEYYRTALPALEDLRQFFQPYLAPIDKLRLLLQERWPAGSLIESLHGRPMFCGLIRAFGEGSEARPHQDMTHWDVPDSVPARSLKTQIATNVYMAAAERGGDLELWTSGIADPKTYAQLQTPGDYGLDRARIGASAVRIKPQAGDLIMFDARRIHAVNRIDRGMRVAASTFIGYRGPTQPLTLYS